MAKIKHYGIKFPVTVKSAENTLLDLNLSKRDKVKSELMHVIFTPKGQRLRDPLFGTRLISFIFNPNDNMSWSDIITEVRDAVRTHVPDCDVKDITTDVTADGYSLACTVHYTVTEDDGSVSADTITTII